ncbi:MAG: EAL domain-containing protein [Pseudomonadota bacterium]
MVKFRKISTKLGVVYSSLFLVMALVLSGVTYKVVTDQAESIVGEGMVAAGGVFSRLFVDRAIDIQDDARLQAKDFGFRSAVASGDGPTIVSALTTLKGRLQVEALAIVAPDGEPLGEAGKALPLREIVTIASTTFEDEGRVGDPAVVFVGEAAVLVGLTPVLAPDLIGWVVFGDVIDAADLADLEALAPIRLKASLTSGDEALQSSNKLAIVDGNFSLRKALPAMLPGTTAVLTLTYPLATALAPYYVLLASLLIVVLLGVVAVSLASWGLAGRLTRPISALVEATQQVRRGERATVTITTRDELARLATDFNHMSSEIQEREAIIRQSARIDSQTQLPNRLALAEALSADGVRPETIWVASIRIERFSEIRSTIGFDAASKLMVSLAGKLQEQNKTRFVAVISDGLIGTLIDAADRDEAQRLISTMVASVHTVFSVDGSSVDIMVRAGASDVDPAEPGAAIKRSSIAVDQAASNHEDLAFFDPKKYEATRDNLSLMGDLVKALETGTITVAYQPKYDLRSQQPVGVEALVRWKDPVRGPVFPDIFIPLAEETGHIEALTHYVLDKSLKAQETLKQHGYDLCMSINLSGRLVGNERFAEAASARLASRCGEVCFEITETAVIADPEGGIAAIHGFADQGIQISIDDYGSGLSSLAYLKRIPASELKIDKEFVLNIDKNNRDALLVRSTVDLAHSLGMKVTAEGVETKTAAALLAGMGRPSP